MRLFSKGHLNRTQCTSPRTPLCPSRHTDTLGVCVQAHPGRLRVKGEPKFGRKTISVIPTGTNDLHHLRFILRFLAFASLACAYSLQSLSCSLALISCDILSFFVYLCVLCVCVLLLAPISCVDSTSSLDPAASMPSKLLLHTAGNLLVQAQGLLDSTDSNFARRTCERFDPLTCLLLINRMLACPVFLGASHNHGHHPAS
jgi:hypothetical protein